MWRIVLWLLHWLNPESAHHLGIFGMKVMQKFGIRAAGSRRRAAISASRPLPWPVTSRLGLAAGFDKNAEAFPFLASLGFGFIEVGTVTPLPQAGNPRPRIFRLRPDGLINRLGFNNVGLVAVRKNIARLRPKANGVPILANVGKGKETPPESASLDYQKGIVELRDLVDGFVINISSPNTPGLRALQTESFLDSLVPCLQEARGKPVFVKLAPDLSDEELRSLCRWVHSAKEVTGVVLTNTSLALAQAKSGETGGFSGAALLSRSLECVRMARDILGEKIIIGVGGVSSPEDYYKMRQAGADLVEVYTAFVYQGPPLISELSGLE